MVQLRKNLELKHVARYFKNIIYADNAVVVVNKPSGLICQSNNNPVSLKNFFFVALKLTSFFLS